MIIDKKVLINITERNITYFKEKGYIINLKDSIEINIEDLKRFSRVLVKIKCDQCGKESTMKYNKYMDNFDRCGFYTCKKCSYTKKKISNNINFGVDNPMMLSEFINKGKQTKKEKYGDENYNNNEKHIKTNLEKFGVKHHLQNKNILDKQKKTNLIKFGVEHACQNIDVKQKIKYKLNKTKFNQSVELYKSKYNLIIKDKKDSKFIIKCDKCNNDYEIIGNVLQLRLIYNNEPCTICNPLGINNISQEENNLYMFIEENYNGTIIKNTKKIISPYELDIYLPELNLAFEFNGLYWHNELYKDKNFHKMKSDMCDEKGIQLLHIYDDDWLYKSETIKSMILYKLHKVENKIFARKTEVKEITDNKLVKDFLETSHIQGFSNSSIKLGLFYNDELVSLMTFGKLRKIMNMKSVDNTFELIRFCNKLNTNVIGGASKLFKYFLENYDYTEIISYADRSYSNGGLYRQLGFELQNITPPNHYYIINNQRKHRFNFRKSELVKNGYDINKTEYEIMLERKIYKIYNSGNYKFIYKHFH